MEMPGVLLKCFLTKNIGACANERIPRRARKSAFLGIVHFAHCQKLLACQGSLNRKVFLANRQKRKWFLINYVDFNSILKIH